LTGNLFAQDDADAQAGDDENEDAVELNRVVVTGSRIARTDIEGPAPVVVITSEQIEMEGFTTINEVLQTLTQNANYGQTEADGGTFTQNANAVDLRGLGPGRTLILFNGRRAADYPLPFNSQSNLVNLSAIPAAAVERIEILAGGASAIYGSDAVAGVINVIMKTYIDETSITARIGDTDNGGGQSARLQLTGGWSSDRFSISYAAEYYETDPIWAHERDFMDSYADNPDVINGLRPVVNTRTGLILDGFDQDEDGYVYVDPGSSACDKLPEMEYSFRAGSGYYCGRPDDISQFTMRSERKNISIYSSMEYELSSSTQLYGTFSYWSGDATFTVGTPFWFSEQLGGQYFLNTNGPDVYGIGGRLDLWQRVFSLEELGHPDAAANKFDEDALDFAVGIRGTMFNDRFDYDFTYSHAEYDLVRKRPLLLRAEVDNFFYGPDLGAAIFGYRAHAGNESRIYDPFTASDWAALTGTDRTDADSSNDQVTFVVTGDLFEMPAGPVGFAAVAEWATQDYDIQLDERFGETDNDGNTVRLCVWRRT
jgi:outer membrane receptor protein involved in Fe transport